MKKKIVYDFAAWLKHYYMTDYAKLDELCVLDEKEELLLAKTLISHLKGTTHEIGEEAELIGLHQNHITLNVLIMIEASIFCCNSCGWWCDIGDMSSEDRFCEDCWHEDEYDEDEEEED